MRWVFCQGAVVTACALLWRRINCRIHYHHHDHHDHHDHDHHDHDHDHHHHHHHYHHHHHRQVIDRDLTVTSHITGLVRTSFAILRQLRSVSRSLTQDATRHLVQSLILSRIDYC